jgi:hypothetical protein
MKRTITAVVFATLAAPVLAADLPFEQTQLDRALPQIQVPNTDASSAGSTTGRADQLPFEQTELNRALPNVRERADRVEASDVKHGFTFEQYNPA